MSMVRYSPFDSMWPLTMRDAMDRLLDEGFQPAWRMDLFGIGRRFPVDVYEDKLNYVIEASLPGVKPEDLKVTATGSTITIRATTGHDEKQEKQEKEAKATDSKKTDTYVQRERYTGEMMRIIDLPESINADKITASYRHGVLTLDIPKAGESQTKKIDIAVKE
jgi:HSP20 family protein